MKKKSNNLMFIFVLLVLLPSVFVVPVVNVILQSSGAGLFLENPKYKFLSSLFSSISVIFGIIVVYRHIQKQKKIMSNRFLIDLNDYFTKDENIQRVFSKLMKLENKKYSFNSYDKLFQTDEDKYDLLEYLNFMETLQYFVDERVIKINEINELFSKRLLIAINNPYIQDIKLVKYDYSWINLYRLSRSIIEYKREHNNTIPYEQYSIEKAPNYEKYSKGYYNYKSIKANYFKIFIIASSLFIISIFLINYFILEIDVRSISKIISVIGVIISALSLWFQVIEDNNIDRCRFLFDLNKIYLSKPAFQKIYIAATKNFYHNLPFTEKYNFVKDIDKIDINQYLSFFEGLNVLLEKGVMKIKEIDLLFAVRIFAIVNNPFYFSYIKGNSKNLKNIYKIHFKLTNFRIKDKKNIIFLNNSLEKKDKNYYSIIK